MAPAAWPLAPLSESLGWHYWRVRCDFNRGAGGDGASTGSGAFVSPLPPLPVPPLSKSRAHHAQLHAPSGWRGTRSINGAARATAGAECSAPAAVWRAHAA